MSSKKDIVKKIRIVLTQHFNTQEEAFDFFDKSGNGKLNKSEIVTLLKKAKVSGFIRGLVAKKLIDGYDNNKDKEVNWKEFKKAIKEL